MHSVQKLKNDLRKQFIARRKSLGASSAAEKSRIAQEHVLASPQWLDARQVALFASLPGEISTAILLQEAWSGGRRLFLPKVLEAATRGMCFFPCPGPDWLRRGAYGIMEPHETESGIPFRPDLVLLPGLAFDRAGFRLGYGGGYYDSFLDLVSIACPLVGFAFSFQIIDSLPHAPWDKRVHALCSEEGFVWL